MRNALALTVAVAAWLSAAPGAHSQENTHFALFIGGDGQAPARDAWRRRVQRARMEYDAFAARAVQVYLSYAPPAAPEKHAAHVMTIMRDPTLRAGDIYAAADGFLVFKGRIAGAHTASDFAPMPDERARGLSLAIGAAR